LRPRIEGYAIVSREGMIAEADGSFPKAIEIPADQKHYQDSLRKAGAVVNGKHSAEGGVLEAARKRLILSRKVEGVAPHPTKANALLWNPRGAPFGEAWGKLGAEGIAAVVGGTDVFGLFLDEIGYDTFYLTQAEASVPDGRPVFPGVGKGLSAQEALRRQGYQLGKTRVLDEATNTVLEEWSR
jgi:dihydrofolate reductase